MKANVIRVPAESNYDEIQTYHLALGTLREVTYSKDAK
jgi:hypothetical protein